MANTLANYAFPKIGNMTVADIGPAEHARVLEPIWNEKRETSCRVCARGIEKILDYATARQYRSGDNPAAAITESLPKGKNGKGHHPAIPFADLPAFMEELRERNSLPRASLGVHDFDRGPDGRGPRCDVGRRRSISRQGRGPFPRLAHEGREGAQGPVLATVLWKSCTGLSALTTDRVFAIGPIPGWLTFLLKAMRPYFRRVTVHGFRSCFKDWAAERTNYPNIVSEMALAHTMGDKVEKAYRRGDLFEKPGRKLMAAWASFCAKPQPKATADNVVIPLRKVEAHA